MFLNDESIGACFQAARFGPPSRLCRLLEIAFALVLGEPHHRSIYRGITRLKRICRDAWCGRRNTGSLPVRPANFLIHCQECSPIADNINRTLETLGVLYVVKAD